MANSSHAYTAMINSAKGQTVSSVQTIAENKSHPECNKVIFSQMEFVPWDNPDNIVNAEVEAIAYKMKHILLVLLFLIGGPGNVINMAVFYKQGLKDRVNLCLFALALADELYLIMAMFHHAEQVHLQFTSKERYGPMFTFLANNHLTSLMGFVYVSLVLSAIIASERCLCVLNPLKCQTLLSTKTMVFIIIVVYIVVIGLHAIVSFRLHVGCIFDPVSGVVLKAFVISELYNKHKNLVYYMDGLVFGVGFPGFVMFVVISTTVVTAWKLRQVVTWRAETSSSVISSREVALTKMLIGTSILFIVCVLPFSGARVCWLLFPEMNTGQRNQNFYLTTFWISKLMAYINCSSNICVYYAMGSRYRETFWSLFSRKAKPSKGK